MIKKIFKSKLHKGLILMYGLLAVTPFYVLFMIKKYASFSSSELVMFMAPYFLIGIIVIFILWRAYTIKFSVTDDNKIIIRGFLKTHTVLISDIGEARKVEGFQPGLKFFGVSFLGGFYYYPDIGFTWASTGNLSDLVFIKMKRGRNFLITPNPRDEFLEMINNSKA